jgi:hypothetical protein
MILEERAFATRTNALSISLALVLTTPGRFKSELYGLLTTIFGAGLFTSSCALTFMSGDCCSLPKLVLRKMLVPCQDETTGIKAFTARRTPFQIQSALALNTQVRVTLSSMACWRLLAARIYSVPVARSLSEFARPALPPLLRGAQPCLPIRQSSLVV